jgi:hypothetical protein
MKVPFRLRRLNEAAPATALLVLSRRPEDVLRLCGGLECDPLPEIYAIADGLLLKFPMKSTNIAASGVAGVIRLRSLADNLLLPVDAELVPALREDEAASLGRKRGLVFLPGGRVLGFDPALPLAPSALLGLPNLQREAWQPLPQRPRLAERLTRITLERDEPTPEFILESGADDIANDDPRPESAGVPARTLGNVGYGLGMGLAWLGKALGLPGLARAGARLMSGAMNLVPRLSEKLLGRQEAALRALLREFREGKVERALRRALPLGGDTARGAVPASNSNLPLKNIFYSLQELLRADKRRPSIWFGRFDAWGELEREYRKAADLALRAGDYRRAAFIYGKLLGDYRSAAAALARGGLHRDAAILYLARVRDFQAAAREFEAAGEMEQALALYRKAGLHTLAGDLLRRAGEQELAVGEYRLAASQLAQSAARFYQAGELLLTRAERPDLAREYYVMGWQQRPSSSDLGCAIRLAQLQCQEAKPDDLLALLTEVEAYLAKCTNDAEAARFFNEIAQLAQRPTLAALQDELRDRALLGIAARMRRRAGPYRSGDAASGLLSPAAGWSAALVSDASYAARAPARRPGTSP